MKFILNRTSENSIYIDDKKIEDYRVSKKHKVYEENIKKTTLTGEYKEKQFVIEIETLEQLIDFMNEQGSIIIEKDGWFEIPILEIYDSWRE